MVGSELDEEACVEEIARLLEQRSHLAVIHAIIDVHLTYKGDVVGHSAALIRQESDIKTLVLGWAALLFEFL